MHAFPESLHSPSLARSVIRTALADFSVDTVEIAELLVSELATNAILHARSMLVLHLDVAEDRVTVGVEDCSFDRPEPRQSSPLDDAVGGRGLWLVETLASSWGWETTSTGKRVWFELAAA
jgi:anti-sigma regulatory factor (Ser/Thr protein kinase)